MFVLWRCDGTRVPRGSTTVFCGKREPIGALYTNQTVPAAHQFSAGTTKIQDWQVAVQLYKKTNLGGDKIALKSEKPPWCYSAMYFHCILLVFTQQNTWHTSPRFRFSPQQHQTIKPSLGPSRVLHGAATKRVEPRQLTGWKLWQPILFSRLKGQCCTWWNSWTQVVCQWAFFFLDSAEAGRWTACIISGCPVRLYLSRTSGVWNCRFFFLWGPAARYWKMPVINGYFVHVGHVTSNKSYSKRCNPPAIQSNIWGLSENG